MNPGLVAWALVLLMSLPTGLAFAQPLECPGTKKLYKGKCLYPDEIEPLKRKERARQRAAEERRTQQEEVDERKRQRLRKHILEKRRQEEREAQDRAEALEQERLNERRRQKAEEERQRALEWERDHQPEPKWEPEPAWQSESDDDDDDDGYWAWKEGDGLYALASVGLGGGGEGVALYAELLSGTIFLFDEGTYNVGLSTHLLSLAMHGERWLVSGFPIGASLKLGRFVVGANLHWLNEVALGEGLRFDLNVTFPLADDDESQLPALLFACDFSEAGPFCYAGVRWPVYGRF